MIMTYSYIAIGIYVTVCLAILYLTLKQAGFKLSTGGLNREAVGSRQYGWMLVALTVTVTMLGPADALGLSGKGYEYGLIWALAPMGAALAQIIAGLFFVQRIKSHPGENQTLGDILGSKFGRSVRPAVGLIVTLQAIAFAGVLVLAGAQILEVFLGVPKVYGFVLTALPIGFFTAVGGLSSVVRMDIFQAILMALALFVVAGVALTIQALSGSLSDPLLLKTEAFDKEVGYFALFTAFLTYLFGEFLLPIYAQRALIARSPADAKKGFVGAGLAAGTWYFLIAFAGVVAFLGAEKVGNPEFVLFDNLKALFGSTGHLISVASAFAIISLFALLHSTFDGILNSGGVSFSKDLVSGFVPLSDSEQASLSRHSMFGFATLGMIIPFIWPDMITMLLVGYTIWAPTIMPVLVYTLLTDRRFIGGKTFWYAFSSGIFGWLLGEYILPQGYVPSILIGVGMNAAVLFFMHKRHGKYQQITEA